MSASAMKYDYVHLLMDEVLKKDQAAVHRIAQVAQWEWNYKKGHELLSLYQEARDFSADIIIFRLIENCPLDNFDKNVFKLEYKKMIDFFNIDNTANIILTTGFWRHPGDDVIIEIARENDYLLAELGDLGEEESMKAVGLFDHSGVANHPGDEGMKAIAGRIWEKIRTL